MNKRGFTLVELLASMVILGMLATITITITLRRLNESKERSRSTMIASIELAAKNYALEYGDKENSTYKNRDFMYVTLETLLSKDLLTSDLIDKTTNKSLPLDDTVYVTRNNLSIVSAHYDIEQKNHSKITLNDSYNIYIKKGETFTDPGVIALDSAGNNVTSSVIVTGSVDTNKKGTYYITYKHSTTEITRNVVVY